MNELYPGVIVRMAPIPISVLNELKLGQTLELLENEERMEEELNEQTQKVCDTLYYMICHTSDTEKRKQLLNLKRDVYNRRNLLHGFKKMSIQAELKAKIELWRTQRENLTKSREKVKEAFELELVEKSKVLQGIAGHSMLKRAIPLASHSLSDKWTKYLHTPVQEQNKKTRKIERSVALYLTRTVAKTSPFSSLTFIGNGHLNRNPSYKELPDFSWYSHIELNHMVAINLWTLFMQSSLNIVWPLEVNPTLRVLKEDKQFDFMMVERELTTSKFYCQKEKRCAIPYHPQFLNICEFIKNKPFVSIADLKKQLGTQNNPEEIEEYLRKLISLDLISYKFPFSNQGCNSIKLVIDTLKMIQERQNNDSTYEVVGNISHSLSNVDQTLRKSLLPNEIQKEVESQMMTITEALHGKRLNVQPLIYENCYYNEFIDVPKRVFDRFQDDIQSLEKIYVLFDPQVPIKLLLHDIYSHYYENAYELPTLNEFQKKVENTVGDFSDSDVLSHNVLQHLKDHWLYQKWLKLRNYFFQKVIGQMTEEKEEYELSSSLLKFLNEQLPEELKHMQQSSWSYFVQSTSNEELVVNKASDGHGRFMSRFMNQLSTPSFDYMDETKKRVEALTEEDTIVAELNGIFGFNANVHPSFTEYEIEYPGIRSKKEKEKRIPLLDLYVTKDEKTGQLVLYSKEKQKKIKLLYVQFLNLGLLPPFFRFMIYFSQVSNPNLAIHETYYHHYRQKLEQQSVTAFPRIKCNSVVLNRKQWLVNKQDFINAAFQKEDKLNKFVGLHKWLTANHLPKRFYIKANIHDQFSKSNMEENMHYQDAMRKPQYIDAESYHLVQVFFNHLKVFKERFIIEEALPDESLLTMTKNSEKYMSEFLIETYRKG